MLTMATILVGVALLTISSINAEFSGNEPPCNVCGDGLAVPIPYELEDQVPAGFTITCGVLEEAGMGGVIPEHECEMLRATHSDFQEFWYVYR